MSYIHGDTRRETLTYVRMYCTLLEIQQPEKTYLKGTVIAGTMVLDSDN